MISKFFAIFAAMICISAGLHLAFLRAEQSNSMIESIANGLGWYFLARGIYMISSVFVYANRSDKHVTRTIEID